MDGIVLRGSFMINKYHIRCASRKRLGEKVLRPINSVRRVKMLLTVDNVPVLFTFPTKLLLFVMFQSLLSQLGC
jgi:hypothetical protein